MDIELARQALEFYSDPESWQPCEDPETWSFPIEPGQRPIDADGGRLAKSVVIPPEAVERGIKHLDKVLGAPDDEKEQPKEKAK